MQQLKINIYKINMQKNSIMVFKVCYHYELLFEHRTSVTNCTASMKTTKLANWHKFFNILRHAFTQIKCTKNAKTAEHLSSVLTAPNLQIMTALKMHIYITHKLQHVSTRSHICRKIRTEIS